MRVITDGLDFSKIEAGEFLLVQEPFNLKTALKELCSFYDGINDSHEFKLFLLSLF